MRNLFRSSKGRFDPKRLPDLKAYPDLQAKVGGQLVHFDIYEPMDFRGPGEGMTNVDVQFDLVTPIDAKEPPPFDPMWKAIVGSMWKRAEPSRPAGPVAQGKAPLAAGRGNVLIGARRSDQPGAMDAVRGQTYAARINPLKSNLSATPDDWPAIDWIRRTDALTFRGDSRPPATVLGQANGFDPPISRNDDAYIYGPVRQFFTRYMKERFGRDISDTDYRAAIGQTATTPESRSLLVDYMAWRKLCEGESFHLGRMVKDEAMKGYISSSKSPGIAYFFGTSKLNNPECWIYVLRLRGGFVVPRKVEHSWGSTEQEVAQWGRVPAHDILGFRYFGNIMIGGTGPVFMRSSFRKSDPQGFRAMFQSLCHWKPSQG